MSILGQSASAVRRLFSWQGVLVCLAILSLDIHLAKRFQLPLNGTATIQSDSPKIQHMDRDAFRWVPPSISFSIPLQPIPDPLIVTEETRYSSTHVHWLYDRPPPELG
jgi:hypothetical protein